MPAQEKPPARPVDVYFYLFCYIIRDIFRQFAYRA